MHDRDHFDQENLTIAQAVDRAYPDSTTYALAVVDPAMDDVVYAFNGNTELLLSVLGSLQEHLRSKSI
jgi:hypothetical protein